ncbi:MAG: group intron endonuclease [Sporomusa sp.]|nr:group intron endonuclease [Sporomusa sp.]
MDKRKELKLAYKQTPRPMGVYQIKNHKNGKVLVSGSMNLPAFFNSQRFQLSLKSHRNKALQEDWNLYGPDAFSFEILETIDGDKIAEADWRDAVSALEEKWLNTLQPYGDKGYHKQPALAK